ncbi:MAG: universal stress protein [Acidimicrobiia bacterium]
METIVVGVDGSDEARAALEWALAEARLRGARVKAVIAWQAPAVEGFPYTNPILDPGRFERAAEGLLDEEVAKADPDRVVEVERVVAWSSPSAALLEAAEGAAMVVVGSRGRGGFTGLLLGSVSQQVAHHATCPVVIVRA